MGWHKGTVRLLCAGPFLRRILIGIAHHFPLIEKARIDLTNHGAKINFDGLELFGLRQIGNSLRQRLVNVGNISQQNTFGALQIIISNVFIKSLKRFVHFARHRLGANSFLPHPRMFRGKGVKRIVNIVAVWLWILAFFQLCHAFFVFHAFHFHFIHAQIFNSRKLLAQNDVWIFENGFN